MPWATVAAAIALVVWGHVAIARAEELGAAPATMSSRHLIWLGLAAVLAPAGLAISYRRLCQGSYLLLAVCLAMLVAVYATQPINGARRWLAMGSFSFQPSELTKLAFIATLARYLMYRENHRRLGGLLLPLLGAMVPVLLVLRQPDLGTALVFLPVLGVLLWTAGAQARHLALVGVCGLLLLPVLWFQMSAEQRSRITALAEQNRPDQLPTADGYHLHQAKQVRALGGAWGSWWHGEPTEDRLAYHLPAAATDFIFAVVGERWGLAGSLAMLGLYAVMIGGLLQTAQATHDPQGRLLTAGVAALFATEVLINTAMTIGLAPITGLSLPLVSYGGSGLVTHVLALALVVNVALRPGYQLHGEPFRFADRSAPHGGIPTAPWRFSGSP